jgi:hypothetical protein
MKRIITLIIFAIGANLIYSKNAVAQIAQRGSSTTNSGTGTSIQINKPNLVVMGDVMIVNIVKNITGDASLAGWNVISSGVINGASVHSTLLYKVATNSEPANYTFSIGGSNGSNRVVGSMVAFSGVDVSGPTPFDVVPGPVLSTGSGTTATATAITTNTANAAVVMFTQAADDNSWSAWQAANMGNLNQLYSNPYNPNSGQDLSVGAAWLHKTVVGSTGNGTATQSNDPWGAKLIALKSASFNPQESVGCNGQYYVSFGSGGSNNSTTSIAKLAFAGLTVTPSAFATDPTGIGFNGIGLNPLDGFMYGIRYDDLTLIRIAANTPGNVVDLGAISGGVDGDDQVYAGCFDSDGDYYFITDDDDFLKIEGINYPATPLTVTDLGTSNPASGFFIDLAIDPTTGTLYGIAGTDAGTKHLYTINKANGNLTLVGTYSGDSYIAGLFFDELGNLFGYRQNGDFLLIDKTNAALTPAGTGSSYTYADGCSCSFGRVFHDLDAPNGICPTAQNPNPTFNITISVTNQSNSQKTGLTYTLEIPGNRFSFNQTAAQIASVFFAAGMIPANNPALVTISSTTGTNNKLVVTSFQTGGVNATLNAVLQLKLVTLGGIYTPVPLQSVISGLPAVIGLTDLSNDPQTPAPDDATLVSFCGNITLPVTLVSFNGTHNNGINSLTWEAEDETNFAGYIIERSLDGQKFESVAMKTPKGGTSRNQYMHLDDVSNRTEKVFWYRLRMNDIDGKYSYSKIILLRKESLVRDNQMLISPNPVTQAGVATVQVDLMRSGSAIFTITDVSGKVVLSQQNSLREGTNSVSLLNLELLSPGMYVLKMQSGDQTIMTKFVVTK